MARRERIDKPAETSWAATDKDPHPKRRAPRGQSVRDIMTPEPEALEATATVMHAAELMRERDVGDVVDTFWQELRLGHWMTPLSPSLICQRARRILLLSP